jgi:POT family proton-dependent oligopeptide transporter
MIIPTLNALVYSPLEKRGRPLAPLTKMSIGMFLAAFAFAAAALLQTQIEGVADGGAKVHVLYQIVQYFVMTTAEVLVSVTGLEFAYTQAPRTMKSTIMGFWLLCVTGGNVLVAFLAPMETILDLSEFFWVFTGLMAFAAVVFVVLARFYKGKTYLQAA